MTALPHRHGLRPPKPARAPLRSKSDGRGATRERGRPARMLSRCVPLSFPAMRLPATLPAGTAWARPKQSPGPVAGRPGWRRWPRLCQDLCGRDARAPGGASSHDVVAAKEVHRSSCLFVVRPRQQSSVSSSNDLSVRAGAALACSRNPPLTDPLSTYFCDRTRVAAVGIEVGHRSGAGPRHGHGRLGHVGPLETDGPLAVVYRPRNPASNSARSNR